MKKVTNAIIVATVLSVSFLPGLQKEMSVAAAVKNQSPTVEQKNPYYVAGIDDAKAFESYFTSLQKEIKAGDKNSVANRFEFPLTVSSEKNGEDIEIIIKTKQEFIQKYDQILTKSIKAAFLNQKVNELLMEYTGVMVGTGEAWIAPKNTQNNTKEQYSVYAINNKMIGVKVDQDATNPMNKDAFTFYVDKFSKGYTLEKMEWKSNEKTIVNTVEQAVENDFSESTKPKFTIGGSLQIHRFNYDAQKMKGQKGVLTLTFKNEAIKNWYGKRKLH
ncbi:hypothetical protein [Brevibacillus brevis]|uniref:hypothetical protein n=1 Tax=Brevibacillus brevis TaxID=1393 RepID=UPI0025A5D969|nr:hypothetical protein [Brevibacillus brevis]WJQ79813.1 hypothetical protein QN310_20310 [Brevibacillus brevis]